MKKSLYALGLSTIICTGCATTKSIEYPQTNPQTTLSVSSDALSALTEVGSSDYFIKDSQITVGDASNTASKIPPGLFGLIGFGVATAVDKSLNSSAIGKSNLNSPIKFDDLVEQKFNQILSTQNYAPAFKVLAKNNLAEIKVTPYSRISFQNKPQVAISFGLKTQFKNAADQNSMSKRRYIYINPYQALLSQWDQQNNALFKQHADEAFSKLSQVIALDIQHQLKFDTLSPEKNNCPAQTVFGSQKLHYIKTTDDLCVAVIKTSKGKAVQTEVFVLKQQTA